MKKVLAIFIVLFAAAFVTQGYAKEAPKHQWEISALGGGVFPADDDQDAAGYFAGRLNYNLCANTSIGVESGWMGFTQEEGGADYGDVNGVPLLANLFIRMPLEAMDDKLVPYVVGSVGVTFWSYDESSLLTSNNVSVESDTSFTARVGGGADYYLTENIAIFGEGGYIWSDYDAKVRASGAVVAATIDTDVAYALGGVKFAF